MKVRLSTLRWPLTAATAGVAVLWVGSIFARAWWYSQGGSVALTDGSVSIVNRPTFGLVGLPPSGFELTGWPGWQGIRPWPSWRLKGPRVTFVIIPLWMPLVVTGVFTARSWRSHRARTTAADRARTGACPRCGYAREGLAPAAPCPECALVPSPPPAT